jgi:hypothetical protein
MRKKRKKDRGAKLKYKGKIKAAATGKIKAKRV